MEAGGKVHLQNWMTASGVTNGASFPVFEIEIAGVKTTIGMLLCKVRNAWNDVYRSRYRQPGAYRRITQPAKPPKAP